MVITMNGIEYKLEGTTSDVTADTAEKAISHMMKEIKKNDFTTFSTTDGRIIAIGKEAVINNGVISFVPVTEKEDKKTNDRKGGQAEVEVVIMDFDSLNDDKVVVVDTPIESLYLSYDGGRFELKVNEEIISKVPVSNDFVVHIGKNKFSKHV